MIHLYDNSIVESLQKSFDEAVMGDSPVKVIPPELAIGVVAQIQNDEVSFPLVVVTRPTEINIDTNLMNFTRRKRGAFTGFDNANNLLYYEKVMPITLTYSITILTANIVDADELMRELVFKYSEEYFHMIEIPYGMKRKVHFGVVIDTERPIEQSSGPVEYQQTGQLYQRIIPLRCEGAVLVQYIPQKLVRHEHEIAVQSPDRETAKVYSPTDYTNNDGRNL